MIRPLEPEDTDTILEIWLRSSVAAHDFVPRSYWEGKLDEMRTRYLPDSRTFVYQDESAESVCGFVSLVENYVAALFVHPDRQGQGIGRRLLQWAAAQYPTLELSVYAFTSGKVSKSDRNRPMRIPAAKSCIYCFETSDIEPSYVQSSRHIQVYGDAGFAIAPAENTARRFQTIIKAKSAN